MSDTKVQTKVRYCVRYTMHSGRSHDLHVVVTDDYSPECVDHMLMIVERDQRKIGPPALGAIKQIEAIEEVTVKKERVLR